MLLLTYPFLWLKASDRLLLWGTPILGFISLYTAEQKSSPYLVPAGNYQSKSKIANAIVTGFLWMGPNSSVHGQSWQDQKLTKRTKQKSSISTAAVDSGILTQKSLSHLSKSFREMPSYTKLTYFMIHRGPWVWGFFSALHYCCYLGDQASTSLPSSMESNDAAHTNYLSTKPVFDTGCRLIFSISLTGQFLFTH